MKYFKDEAHKLRVMALQELYNNHTSAFLLLPPSITDEFWDWVYRKE